MITKLDENTTNRIKEAVEIFKLTRKLLKDWKPYLMMKCKNCTEKRVVFGKCECDVQFFLDLITEFVNGNGGY